MKILRFLYQDWDNLLVLFFGVPIAFAAVLFYLGLIARGLDWARDKIKRKAEVPNGQ